MPELLEVCFEVNDDLTSERVRGYKDTVVDALTCYLESGKASGEQRELIDKMLNDWDRPV